MFSDLFLRQRTADDFQRSSLVDDSSLVCARNHRSVTLEVACDVFLALDRHGLFTLLKLLVGNFERYRVFGDIDRDHVSVLDVSDSTAVYSLG